jgi:homopolymeric O-antigen transport system permease protein
LSVFSHALFSHRELIENLIARDIKARYKQSALGVTWTIVSPLVMALIYTVIGYVFLRQKLAIPFAVYSYFGLLFWNLFSSGVTGATESLVGHLGLITKVRFPREVLPWSAVLAKLTDFGFGLIGAIPLLLFFGTLPGAGIVLVAPLALILVIFAAGIGMLCACANLFYRDVRHLVGLILMAWMYLVPNFYTIDLVPARFRGLFLLNPVAAIVEAARRSCFPQLGPVAWNYVGVAAVISLATFALGYVVFKHYEPRFAEFV